MKKNFTLTLLLAALFYAQFAAAQQTLYVYSKSGNLSAYSANKVTFDNDLLTFTYGDVTEITKDMFTASFKVAFKSDDYKSFKQTPEVGVCYSMFNSVPTIDDDCLSLGSELKSYTFTLKSLTPSTTYYFRTYVKLASGVFYGDVASAKTLGTASVDNSKTIDGHKFIDLGLPSGLLWAETNIGAEKPADDGNYYAWGETQSKSNYSWDTYKYGTSEDNLTKYNSTDDNTVLDNSDDAAYVNWGSSCRMPTCDDFTELLKSSNCTWTWTSQTTSDGSSINGYTVTSIKNGNSIFLPAPATATVWTSAVTARTATTGPERAITEPPIMRTLYTSIVATTLSSATTVTMVTPSAPSQNLKCAKCAFLKSCAEGAFSFCTEGASIFLNEHIRDITANGLYGRGERRSPRLRGLVLAGIWARGVSTVRMCASVQSHPDKVRIDNAMFGVSFLGAYLKPWRTYVNNDTARRCSSV